MPLEQAPYEKIYHNGNPVGERLAFEVPYGGRGIEWRPNTPFEAELRVVSGGGSTFDLLDEKSGIAYQIFMSDMVEVIQLGAVHGGSIHGRFHVIKRNVKYGLKLI